MIENVFENPFLQSIIVIIIAAVAHRLSSVGVANLVYKILKRHESENQTDRKKRANTLSGIFKAGSALIIWMVAVGFILASFDVNLAQVAAGAGFLGIILGIGAQTTIRDYLAGVFILSENQYRVGDIVTLNGGGVSQPTSGVIDDITLRITKLRDLDGNLHIVRNGEASIITNRTYKYSSIVIDIGVTYDSDIDEIEKVANRVGKSMIKDQELAKVIKEPIHFLRITDFADSAIIVRMIGKVSPAKQWDVAGEYRRQLLTAFRENNIEIAFPQVVVHTAKK
jgi:small-conductance mechanosensitive channel